MRRLACVLVLFELGPVACGDELAVADGGDDTTSGTESTTESSTTETGESESDGTDAGDPDPCGDGVVDFGEECDDANGVDDDGCSNLCKSACGSDFAGDLKLPDQTEWFDVQQMLMDGEGILVAGNVETATVGRVRVAAYADKTQEWALESAPLGPAGDPDAPETHDAIAVAAAPGGDVLAVGRSTIQPDPDQIPTESYWLTRLSGIDLSEQWRVPLDGDDPELAPRGLAVLADGDAILTRTTILQPSDSDALVERRTFADGDLVWSVAHSGEESGGYSLDEAAFVAADMDDGLWAAALLRVDWQTHETTLLRISPDDGSASESLVPLPDPGGNHRQRPHDLAATTGDQVALGVTVFGPASKYHFSRAYRIVDGEVAWELTRDDLPWDDGDPYIDPRVAFDANGSVLVAGSYSHDFGFAVASRVWVVKIAPNGEVWCAARIGEGNNGAVVPRNGFFGTGRSAVNLNSYGPGGMGPGSGNNWLIGLRQ